MNNEYFYIYDLFISGYSLEEISKKYALNINTTRNTIKEILLFLDLCKKSNNISNAKIFSVGEEIISEILINNNIMFEREKTFDDCRFPKTNYMARFDFCIYNKNDFYLLEFDGEHHYVTTSYYDESGILNNKRKDLIKNNWCKNHNITLIRIPYQIRNNISLKDLQPETSKYVVYKKV